MNAGGRFHAPRPRTWLRITLVLSLTLAALAGPFQPHVAAATGVSRQSGANRFATAAAISIKTFAPGVNVAYVATGENFPDALAAGPSAAAAGGPVLLVRSGSIPADTAAELSRLNPKKIVIAGGTSVVSTRVQQQLAKYAGAGGVHREAGANRYATAADIALSNFSPGVDVVYVATGVNFPDALAAGPAAAKANGAVLLVAPNGIPAETGQALAALNPKKIVIAGGTSVVSTRVQQQLAKYVSQAPANRAPTAGNDAVTVAEDSPATIISVLANDADPDGDALAVTGVSDPANGAASVTSGGASVRYTPEPNFAGTDTFTYTVSDGVLTDTAQVTVTVTDTADNVEPVAGDDNGGSIANTCWRLVHGVLTNDTDADGDALTITAVSEPAHGVAQIVGTSLRYINDGTTGTDTFTYTVSDGTDTDTATVSMTVVLVADTDGDGVSDACDPFAKVADSAPDAALGFTEEFDDASGDWNTTAFTGLMTNSLDSSLAEVTSNGHTGTGRFFAAASDGEAFAANNTQENAFQVNIATDPALPDFSVHGRVCQPFPPADFASAGIFFGPGDQDNYIKAVLDWHPALDVTSVADTREIDGAGATINRRTAHRGDPSVPLPECIELLINVRSDAGTYHPHYSLNDGTCWYGFGGTTGRTVPASWLDGTYPFGGAPGSRALAVGIISSSIGPSASFDATWDFLRVTPMLTTNVCA
jgi:hypothetical protein